MSKTDRTKRDQPDRPKRDQTINPNTGPKRKKLKTHGRQPGATAQKWTWFDEYRDFMQGKMVPVSEAFIEQLSKDYITWATEDETALILSQFPLSKKIPPDTFYNWINRSPILAQAHTIALTAVGNRRELGGLNKRLSEGMVSFTMPSYNKEWKELQEWRASMKDIKADTNVQKVIVLEKISMPEPKPEPKAIEHKTPEEVARRASMWGTKETHEPYRR